MSTEHRTPEGIIASVLHVSQARGESRTRQADQLVRALGEAGFDVIDALFVYGGEQSWETADLHTLLLTAGEIASHYGTGTDGLDRDDVLSTRQRDVLRAAARLYHAEIDNSDTGEGEDNE